MRVVVAGASGFVGARLIEELAGKGHEVVALSRHPDAAGRPGVEQTAVDVADVEKLTEVLRGAGAAYYLIHSMGGEDFVRRDRELAKGFAEAAASAGAGRIVYLGALGRGKLSPHLASRQEVGRALGSTGVPVVELRAAVVLGSGSVSFEMLRYLTERLPAMVCPRWVRTKIEPVALSDVLRYLAGALEAPPGIYEIGCGQVTTYLDMMHLFARVRGLRKRRIVNVPLLSLHLSGYWVDLITPLNSQVTHTLIESMTADVTVYGVAATLEAFGFQPVDLETAMRKAIDDQADDVPEELFDGTSGLVNNVYKISVEQELKPGAEVAIRKDLAEIGGSLAWYGWPWAWRARFVFGMLIGEKHPVGRPAKLAAGESADWWTIAKVDDDSLVLRSSGWLTGEGWLGYCVTDEPSLQVAAAFRPKGVPGFLYWFVLAPVHKAAFKAMAAARVKRAAAIS